LVRDVHLPGRRLQSNLPRGGNLFGQGEDQVEIPHGQQFSLTCRKPCLRRSRLAFSRPRRAFSTTASDGCGMSCRRYAHARSRRSARHDRYGGSEASCCIVAKAQRIAWVNAVVQELCSISDAAEELQGGIADEMPFGLFALWHTTCLGIALGWTI
jgi:hypothetical protein